MPGNVYGLNCDELESNVHGVCFYYCPLDMYFETKFWCPRHFFPMKKIALTHSLTHPSIALVLIGTRRLCCKLEESIDNAIII